MLKLVPPRYGENSSWRIRGTHHGVNIDKGSGSRDRAGARKAMRVIQDEIERGAFAIKGEPTFADAAEQYMIATGQRRFILPIAEHFAYRAIKRIDAQAINEAAAILYPNASPATRNRQVHTPVSAILRHAGVIADIKRPKGAAGTRRTAYLEPPQAFALIEAATAHDARFGALLMFLLYTGARLNEALSLTWDDVNLTEARVLIRQTKTEGARTAVLPKTVVAAIDALPRRHKVFGLTKCGRPIQAHLGEVDASLCRHGYSGLSRDWRMALARQRIGIRTLGRERGIHEGVAVAGRFRRAARVNGV